MDEQNNSSQKTKIIIGVAIIILVLIGIIGFLFFRKGGEGGTNIMTSLFGELGVEVPRPEGTGIEAGEGIESSGDSPTNENEPLFRQLSKEPVAAATTIARNGETIVRYIRRENGHVYEIDPKTGNTVNLTNTMFPRIQEAYWASNGDAVILRNLDTDRLTQKETIKTYLAYLSIPKASTGSTDSTKLFYLLPIPEGVSGTIVNIRTKEAKEVFRNTFSEWIPQLLNDGTIMLTTKASAKFAGFTYRYNPDKRTLSRVIRKVNGVTSLSNASGERTLYSETEPGKVMLNIYLEGGYVYDDTVRESIFLPLATLPEKCVWAKNNIRIFCGAFVGTPKGTIPDDWYQGTLAFSDTFWTVNTDSSEITYLADPTKEERALRTFDVIHPTLSEDEGYFVFTDKTDLSLWSMKVPKEKYLTEEEGISTETGVPLTEDELKDAAGSSNTR
jgi:hypothetical protein